MHPSPNCPPIHPSIHPPPSLQGRGRRKWQQAHQLLQHAPRCAVGRPRTTASRQRGLLPQVRPLLLADACEYAVVQQQRAGPPAHHKAMENLVVAEDGRVGVRPPPAVDHGAQQMKGGDAQDAPKLIDSRHARNLGQEETPGGAHEHKHARPPPPEALVRGHADGLREEDAAEDGHAAERYERRVDDHRCDPVEWREQEKVERKSRAGNGDEDAQVVELVDGAIGPGAPPEGYVVEERRHGRVVENREARHRGREIGLRVHRGRRRRQ
mmetsp:Transcript_51936/g.130491  ORF Transcript_51936/g.130491 Transcript_51936/m.130491 type:complete len:268 (+) Transcript_51936:528-1331(+)